MGNGFHPFRRDVAWDVDARDTSILPLLDRLSFTAGRSSCGYAFRFGLLQVGLDAEVPHCRRLRVGSRTRA